MRFLTIVLLLTLTLTGPQDASSGTLVLRNGRRVNGRFIKKGKNYVVVQTVKGPLKIRKHLMDRDSWINFAVEEDKVTAPVLELSEVQRVRDNWPQWYPGVADYLNTIDENVYLLNTAENVLAESAEGFKKPEMPKKINRKVDQAFITLRQINTKFKDVAVPVDLQDFHELFLDYQNTMIRSAKNFLMNDGRSYAQALHRCRLSFLESQLVLKAMFDYHGAPQDMLGPVESNIRAYQKTIPYDMMYRFEKEKKHNPYIVPALREEE